MCRAAAVLVAWALVALPGRCPGADPGPGATPGDVGALVPVHLDSGPVRGPEGGVDRSRPAFEGVVRVAGASSVRLVFDHTRLGGGAGSDDDSYLLITSLLDGQQQYMNAKHLGEWGGTSAYFNGDEVLVQLFPAPDAGESRVEVVSAMVEMPGAAVRSLCGSTDDRELSDDLRVGRIWPIGCTAWLFDGHDRCLITAGHCGPYAWHVVEFNVPPSGVDGVPRHPGPDDQYAIDGESVQTSGVQEAGDDWACFGVFDNSTTGMSPLEAASGGSFTLGTGVPAATGQTARVTGYGDVAPPVSASWYGVQKVGRGPYEGLAGTTIMHAADTTSGDSGAPILDESTGLVVGIHTHAGCDTDGVNRGTAIFHPALQGALANPLGVCRPGMDIEFLAEPPAWIAPGGGTTIGVGIAPQAGVSLDPTSVRLHMNAGDGWTESAMAATGGSYSCTFPPVPCGAAVAYYVSAADSVGVVYTAPVRAPLASLSALSGAGLAVYAEHDFEANPGWSVQNTAVVSGGWEVGVPGNFGRSDPPADFDGSGRCWMTGNTDTEDLDGGPTVLTSIAYDLSATTDPLLRYARWHQTDDASGSDNMVVELSDDGGASWSQVESVPSTPGWTLVSVNVSDFVALTAQVRVRFTVSDNPNASVTESGVDAVSIVDVICGSACSAADLNGDGALNLDDIDAFVVAFLVGSLAADLDGSGAVNLDDVDAFVAAFGPGCI